MTFLDVALNVWRELPYVNISPRCPQCRPHFAQRSAGNLSSAKPLCVAMRRTDVIAANMLGLGVIFTKPAFPNALLLNPMYLGLQHPHARAE